MPETLFGKHLLVKQEHGVEKIYSLYNYQAKLIITVLVITVLLVCVVRSIQKYFITTFVVRVSYNFFVPADESFV